MNGRKNVSMVNVLIQSALAGNEDEANWILDKETVTIDGEIDSFPYAETLWVAGSTYIIGIQGKEGGFFTA